MKQILLLMGFVLISGIAYSETYTVENVIDGYTLKLTNGEEVQLIGIRAPEDEKNNSRLTEVIR